MRAFPACLLAAALFTATAARADGAPAFTLLDRTDAGGRFEVLGTLQTRSTRIWFNKGTNAVNASTVADSAWWVTPASPGIQLVDRTDGPIAWLFKALTVGIMAAPVNRVGYTDSTGYHEGYAGRDASGFMGVELPASVLDFTWSPEMRGGTLSGSNGSWLGMTFGYLQYPGWKGIEDITPLDPTSTSTGVKFLRKQGAFWTVSNHADEKIANVDLRLPLNVPVIGGVSVVWNLPMAYTVFALMKPLLGGGEDEGFLEDWGIPRVRIQASRSIGPLTVAGEYVIPARWLVVPYHTAGAHFGVQAGLKF